MSNKRKDGKKNKNVWLTQSEREVLSAVRETLGLDTDSDAIKRAINELARQKGIIK